MIKNCSSSHRKIKLLNRFDLSKLVSGTPNSILYKAVIIIYLYYSCLYNSKSWQLSRITRKHPIEKNQCAKHWEELHWSIGCTKGRRLGWHELTTSEKRHYLQREHLICIRLDIKDYFLTTGVRFDTLVLTNLSASSVKVILLINWIPVINCFNQNCF